MKPKVENVCSSSSLPRTAVTAILATLMNSDDRYTMRVFWLTFCHSFITGFLSHSSSLVVGLHCQLEERGLIAKGLGVKNRVHLDHLGLFFSAMVNAALNQSVTLESSCAMKISHHNYFATSTVGTQWPGHSSA
jgi:hypothetical protein